MRRSAIQDEPYKEWIRKQPCCICGHLCRGDKPNGKPLHNAVHHTAGAWNDHSTVPLCDFTTSGACDNCHHDKVHNNMRKYKEQLNLLATGYLKKYNALKWRLI